MNEWARELKVSEGELVAVVTSEDGTLTSLPLAGLHDRGLPDRSGYHLVRRETEFAAWTRAASGEYEEFFGLPKEGSRHAVLEASDGRIRFLVPALAWIRAFFRPSRFMMDLAFRAHGLEQVLYMDHSEGAVKFNPGSLRDAALRFQEVYTWMMAYPSAAGMVGSIHKAAMNGEIDITLPRGQARVTMQGNSQSNRYVGGRYSRNTVYVTAMTLSQLSPSDEPMFSLARQTPNPIVILGENAGRWPRLQQASEPSDEAEDA